MIYIFENIQKLDKGFVEQTFLELSIQRKKKIEGYKILSDKINSCIAFLLLRYALKNEYNIDEKPEFVFGKYGKPFLKDYPNIFFSISHCKTAVACAVSNHNIALDIMDFRKVKQSVIKRVCSADEQIVLSKSNSIDKDFTRLWVMKECYAKLDGRGLSLDFKKLTSELTECGKIRFIETKQYILGYIFDSEPDIIRCKDNFMFNS